MPIGFGTAVSNGVSYSVTILTQPTGLSCSIISGATGTVASASVTNVNLGCSPVSETYAWGTFTDNFDGTVQFVVMKCSQGQTWNSGTNSCTGVTGIFAYCNEQDNDCNGGSNSGTFGSFIGNGASLAFSTCDTLDFASKTDWRVPTKNELKTLVH